MTLDPNTKQQLKGEILEFAQNNPPKMEGKHPDRRLSWGTGFVITALILLLLVPAGITEARDALPGETLYPIKRLAEAIQLATTRDPAKKEKLKTQQVQRRQQELREVMESGTKEQKQQAQQEVKAIMEEITPTPTPTLTPIPTPTPTVTPPTVSAEEPEGPETAGPSPTLTPTPSPSPSATPTLGRAAPTVVSPEPAQVESESTPAVLSEKVSVTPSIASKPTEKDQKGPKGSKTAEPSSVPTLNPKGLNEGAKPTPFVSSAGKSGEILNPKGLENSPTPTPSLSPSPSPTPRLEADVRNLLIDKLCAMLAEKDRFPPPCQNAD